MNQPDFAWPDAPTLGFLVVDWVERHCIIPDGFRKGQPFTMYDWQQWCTLNHYEVRHDARPAGTEYTNADGEQSVVSGASAFRYRRSVIIAPQKAGKGPWSATITTNEAVGPALFAGWAEPADTYRCSEHGCGCGWEQPYGEYFDMGLSFVPKGKPWPTPLIQLVATAETQVDNVYRPLQAMARGKMLAPLMQVTEDFIRCPNDGRIDVVTSNAQSKLGNPIIFALQDESGLYTVTNKMVTVAQTQRRGAAGMGGRSMETTNAFDPTRNSTAQQSFASSLRLADIFVFWRRPPDELGDYTVKADRRRVHAFVYKGCEHVDLDAIEAEAVELLGDDPRQAERFYGNRDVAGSAKWTTPEEWAAKAADMPITVDKREQITLGFDGSDGTATGKRRADATVLRGCRLSDGYRWTIAAWEHQPEPDGEYGPWYVPRDEVLEKIHWAFAYFDVVLAGFDPPFWRAEVSALVEKYGDDRIVEFLTSNDRLMANALERLKLSNGRHDGCPIVAQHAVNAVTVVKEYRDDNDERKRIVLVSKASKDSPDKIDGLISDAIANDMRDRAIAAGARKQKKKQHLVTFR